MTRFINTLLLLLFSIQCFALTPGSARVLTCPFCKKEKEVMTVASGNNIGAQIWSDNKRICPMYPEVSVVQKCNHCGKYFMTTRQEFRQDSTKKSGEQGLLTFPEMKEAYAQFVKEGFSKKQEEATVRFMLFHAYNDYYYRSETKREVTEEDHALFVEQGKWLVEQFITDEVMKAELYREIGDLGKAQAIIDKIPPSMDLSQQIVEMIRAKIKAKDTKVFIIKK